jgi:hypothetical protein
MEQHRTAAISGQLKFTTGHVADEHLYKAAYRYNLVNRVVFLLLTCGNDRSCLPLGCTACHCQVLIVPWRALRLQLHVVCRLSLAQPHVAGTSKGVEAPCLKLDWVLPPGLLLRPLLQTPDPPALCKLVRYLHSANSALAAFPAVPACLTGSHHQRHGLFTWWGRPGMASCNGDACEDGHSRPDGSQGLKDLPAHDNEHRRPGGGGVSTVQEQRP